ncbi:hypothetical protein L6452_13851 [Arctium lappa]|uniref:Uncharacterized protein n=1 Tax=Arctium lappa TaxID=4217 RepID=A0ACB9CJF5_ARCLA|nr:hypothetical protein L6452_13851 [Arctium lappa]
MMDLIPDSVDLSLTVDFDQYFNESLVFSMRSDQADKLQNLEKLYGQPLDDNTRLYTNYFKDCMNYTYATSKKAIPMLPIAKPPMTPLHEGSLQFQKLKRMQEKHPSYFLIMVDDKVCSSSLDKMITLYTMFCPWGEWHGY